MELSGLEDAAEVAVYADHLEERGDPRGALVRHHLLGLPIAQLLEAHWKDWLGTLPADELLLRWSRGHVVEAAVRAPPVGFRLPELLARPALRFLRRLALSPRVAMGATELQHVEHLQRLDWFTGRETPLDALGVAHLPALKTLTLEIQTAHLEGLAAARLPALRHLDTQARESLEAGVVRAVGRAGFWPTLVTWTHRVRTPEGLAALLACQPLLARQGRGLKALCEAAVLAQLTPAHRAALPEAEFIARPVPAPPFDREDFQAPAEVTVAPQYAAVQFREQPWSKHSERSTQSEHDTDTVITGAGRPYADLTITHSAFTACGWCGSADTLCIYVSDSYLYSHYETTSYWSWEHECQRCGLFTHSRNSRTR